MSSTSKRTDEMYDLFAMVPEACSKTPIKIAEQCNFEFDLRPHQDCRTS